MPSEVIHMTVNCFPGNSSLLTLTVRCRRDTYQVLFIMYETPDKNNRTTTSSICYKHPDYEEMPSRLICTLPSDDIKNITLGSMEPQSFTHGRSSWTVEMINGYIFQT